MRRAPPPFAGYNLVAEFPTDGIERPDDNGLNEPLGAYRLGQLLKILLAHIHARLVTASMQEIDWNLLQKAGNAGYFGNGLGAKVRL